MKDEIKNIYKKILELNIQINLMLNDFPKNDFDSFNKKLEENLDLKSKFIQKLLSLEESFEKEFQGTDFKEIFDQVNDLEQENLELILEKKFYLSKEINRVSKSAKALSAYKVNKQNKPRIFDETD